MRQLADKRTSSWQSCQTNGNKANMNKAKEVISQRKMRKWKPFVISRAPVSKNTKRSSIWHQIIRKRMPICTSKNALFSCSSDAGCVIFKRNKKRAIIAAPTNIGPNSNVWRIWICFKWKKCRAYMTNTPPAKMAWYPLSFPVEWRFHSLR